MLPRLQRAKPDKLREHVHQRLMDILHDTIIPYFDMQCVIRDFQQLAAVKADESDRTQTQRFRNIDGADDIR